MEGKTAAWAIAGHSVLVFFWRFFVSLFPALLQSSLGFVKASFFVLATGYLTGASWFGVEIFSFIYRTYAIGPMLLVVAPMIRLKMHWLRAPMENGRRNSGRRPARPGITIYEATR
jgi:hypothetical protein